MEQSAFEALMVGVNVFIFVAALSAGILLMSSLIDMVNFANEQAIVGMNGTLAESVGVVTERIYTGSQMLNYYKKNIESEDTVSTPSDYIFKVKLQQTGHEKLLKDYIESESIINYINKEFILNYKGKDQDKYVYVFSLKEE